MTSNHGGEDTCLPCGPGGDPAEVPGNAIPISPDSICNLNLKKSEGFFMSRVGGSEDVEEAFVPKTRRKPEEPTKDERRAHAATHLPFRSWCKHCVAARAKAWPHLKQKESEN